MSGRLIVWEVVLVLAITAAVLYLDWWRRGELELLTGRVDELDARTTPAKPKPKKTPEVTT